MANSRTRVLAAASLAVAGLLASPASAEPKTDADAPAESVATATAPASADSVEAGRLFAEARTLYDTGRYEQACLKFEESLKKREGIGIKFNLADCWERTGRTASAHRLFHEVAAATKRLGQTEREALARDRAAALEPRLSRLQIQMSGSTEGVEVLRNGVKLGRDALGVPFPVDPGTHEIHIIAEGKKPWSSRLTVPPEPAAITAVVVPPLDDAEPAAARVAPTETPVPKRVPAAPASEPAPGTDDARRAASLALVGVGVVGLAVGGAMAAQYDSSRRDAERVCPSARNCTPAEVALHDSLVDDARNARTWTFVGLGVGGAALLSAAYLHLTGPPRSEEPQSVSVSAAPALSESILGASVSGRF